MISLRPLEGVGHEPFLVEFQEVFTVGYVPDLRHHKKKERRGEGTPPLVILSKERILLTITNLTNKTTFNN